MDNNINQPSVSDSAASVEDRRRSERVDERMPGWISGESNDRSAKGSAVMVVDMSMHGVGFHDAAHHYRVGSTHWLVVNGGAMRMSTRVKIVSCRESDEGGFYIGAKFF